MHVHPTPSAPTEPQTAADTHAQKMQQYGDLLHEMIHKSADLARQAYAQSQPQAPSIAPQPVSLSEITIAFDRATRCMRRCIALAQRLGEARPAQAAPAQRQMAARQRIIRAVEDNIHNYAYDDEAGELRAELYERMEAPEFDDALDTSSLATLIGDLCCDLGLPTLPGLPPKQRRTPDAIAVLRARAARTPLPAFADTPHAPQGQHSNPDADPEDCEAAIPLYDRLLL